MVSERGWGDPDAGSTVSQGVTRRFGRCTSFCFVQTDQLFSFSDSTRPNCTGPNAFGPDPANPDAGPTSFNSFMAALPMGCTGCLPIENDSGLSGPSVSVSMSLFLTSGSSSTSIWRRISSSSVAHVGLGLLVKLGDLARRGVRQRHRDVAREVQVLEGPDVADEPEEYQRKDRDEEQERDTGVSAYDGPGQLPQILHLVLVQQRCLLQRRDPHPQHFLRQ
eukprot:CAMPEP_0177734712 /NCGR_PEP_ID=MMETSP0484_2-20121128/24383_1 /TAXON_ID=354590 /ORGANISM="Rhodomonas lens, Strain RHODO" /LENGTH=220 /DNA_ID=CAMNT_0019248215 /DNA_START=149 /DNA_END=808 /DNA_ORIENTATION=+